MVEATSSDRYPDTNTAAAAHVEVHMSRTANTTGARLARAKIESPPPGLPRSIEREMLFKSLFSRHLDSLVGDACRAGWDIDEVLLGMANWNLIAGIAALPPTMVVAIFQQAHELAKENCINPSIAEGVRQLSEKATH